MKLITKQDIAEAKLKTYESVFIVRDGVAIAMGDVSSYYRNYSTMVLNNPASLNPFVSYGLYCFEEEEDCKHENFLDIDLLEDDQIYRYEGGVTGDDTIWDAYAEDNVKPNVQFKELVEDIYSFWSKVNGK